MDLQAQKIAQNMEEKSEPAPDKRKRKRGQGRTVQSPDSDFVRKKFENVKESIRTYFDAPPSADVLRSNNAQLRELTSMVGNTSHLFSPVKLQLHWLSLKS
jgi:hypothetical protein